MGALSDSTSRGRDGRGREPSPPTPRRRARPRRLGEVLDRPRACCRHSSSRRRWRPRRPAAGRLGEVLLDLGMIGPVDLVRSLAEQFGLEFVDLDHVEIDRALAQRVPQPLARRHRAVPICGDRRRRAGRDGQPGGRDRARRHAQHPPHAGVGRSWPTPARSASWCRGRSTGRRTGAGRHPPGDGRRRRQRARATRRCRSQAESTLDDGPIVRFVDLMINRAVQERASDIHIEPTGDRAPRAIPRRRRAPRGDAPAARTSTPASSAASR